MGYGMNYDFLIKNYLHFRIKMFNVSVCLVGLFKPAALTVTFDNNAISEATIDCLGVDMIINAHQLIHLFAWAAELIVSRHLSSKSVKWMAIAQ
jgi:hypothetical protein